VTEQLLSRIEKLERERDRMRRETAEGLKLALEEAARQRARADEAEALCAKLAVPASWLLVSRSSLESLRLQGKSATARAARAREGPHCAGMDGAGCLDASTVSHRWGPHADSAAAAGA
jgi:hypothetical protein